MVYGRRVQRDTRFERIFLVGFMGSGKSTVARALAERRGAPCFDTDAWIESREGRTIAEIFRDEGEARFRALESEALAEACRPAQVVVATGGGLFADPLHRERIRERGVSVWLDASLERVWERCRATVGRPLFGGLEELRRLYEERRPGYALADWRVAMEDRGIDEIVEEVHRLVGRGEED
jgi:shikimate kinase